MQRVEPSPSRRSASVDALFDSYAQIHNGDEPHDGFLQARLRFGSSDCGSQVARIIRTHRLLLARSRIWTAYVVRDAYVLATIARWCDIFRQFHANKSHRRLQRDVQRDAAI